MGQGWISPLARFFLSSLPGARGLKHPLLHRDSNVRRGGRVVETTHISVEIKEFKWAKHPLDPAMVSRLGFVTVINGWLWSKRCLFVTRQAVILLQMLCSNRLCLFTFVSYREDRTPVLEGVSQMNKVCRLVLSHIDWIHLQASGMKWYGLLTLNTGRNIMLVYVPDDMSQLHEQGSWKFSTLYWHFERVSAGLMEISQMVW